MGYIIKTNGMKKTVISVEYWFDGITSSYQVDKKEYYNSYLIGLPKFRLIIFDDGSRKIYYDI